MDDDCAYDLDWWRKAQAQSVERNKAKRSARSIAQKGDTFLIVTEGKITEPVYLNCLRSLLNFSALTIKIVSGDTPDPIAVIQTASRVALGQKKKRGKGQLGYTDIQKYDQVWAVIDTDKVCREDRWAEVKAEADRLKVKLAHSTPCFEFWLILHNEFTTRSFHNGTEISDYFERVMRVGNTKDYKTAQKTFPELVKNYPTAVKNAARVRQHHSVVNTATTVTPPNPYTEVDELVRALNDAAPPPYRKDLA